jgi:predicted nucleic acid-binding protein
MIVLDTNVVTEAMQPSPSEAVLRWLSEERGQFFLTTITVGEIMCSIQLLPNRKRQDRLRAQAEAMFTEDFSGRILPFDEKAAREFAEIVAGRCALGRPIAELDAQIAAIASANHAILATRNPIDFDGCGVRLANPWNL